MNKTTMITAKEIKRQWHLVDLDSQNLGRSSTKIAKLLIGKNKADYTPHLDCGDYVVIINAESVVVTGSKEEKKLYRHHTGYPGGFRELTFKQVKSKDPKKIVEKAIKGMIPKNKLRASRMKRLKIYIGQEHPYKNQIEQSEQ